MANGAHGVNVIKLSLPPQSQQDKLAPDMFFFLATILLVVTKTGASF